MTFFFRKSCRLWDNVEKYDGDRGATNDVTIWRIRFAWWIHKVTCTYAHAHAHAHACTHRPISNAFQQQQCFANAPQCYVVRTLYCYLFLPPSFPFLLLLPFHCLLFGISFCLFSFFVTIFVPLSFLFLLTLTRAFSTCCSDLQRGSGRLRHSHLQVTLQRLLRRVPGQIGTEWQHTHWQGHALR